VESQLIKSTELRTAPPFEGLFPIEDSIKEAIKESMQAVGYDWSKPLDTWNGIVVDGHTRLIAALEVSLPEVAIYPHDFEDENEALDYAIHNQRDRRNLNDADILRLVKVLDRRKSEGRPKKTGSSEPVSGRSAEITAETINTSSTKVKKARTVLDYGDEKTKAAVIKGKQSINAAYTKIQRKRKREKAKEDGEVETVSVPTFNRTNTNIEWASWSWNPITGCEHDCDYCYARDIANRFYPQGFKPTFHEHRLNAPANMKAPKTNSIGDRSVFVCSMADLFGEWVPQEWIDKVLDTVHKSSQWNYIFLTKNPARMIDIDWPDNAWVGTTVDCQARVLEAEKTFKQITASVRFVSCEPMLERIQFRSMEMFDWVIIGGQSKSSKCPAFQPDWLWVEDLILQSRCFGCKVYFKPNLAVRPKEYP
jgi:protein gp37